MISKTEIYTPMGKYIHQKIMHLFNYYVYTYIHLNRSLEIS
jgi:hypothetical protein